MANKLTTTVDIVPMWERGSDHGGQVRRKTQEAMEVKYNELYGGQDFLIRQLQTDDLGLVDWSTPGQALQMRSAQDRTSKWRPWVNTCAPPRSIIGFTGIRLLDKNPRVGKLRFYMESDCVGIYDLSCLRALLPVIRQGKNIKDTLDLVEKYGDITRLPMVGYFNTPFIFSAEVNFRIDIRSYRSSFGHEEVMLTGLIAETYGKTLRI